MSVFDIYYIWPWTTQNLIALLLECISKPEDNIRRQSMQSAAAPSVLFEESRLPFFQNSGKCESSVSFSSKLKLSVRKFKDQKKLNSKLFLKS